MIIFSSASFFFNLKLCWNHENKRETGYKNITVCYGCEGGRGWNRKKKEYKIKTNIMLDVVAIVVEP